MSVLITKTSTKVKQLIKLNRYGPFFLSHYYYRTDNDPTIERQQDNFMMVLLELFFNIVLMGVISNMIYLANYSFENRPGYERINKESAARRVVFLNS